MFAVWTQALGNWINKLSPAYGYERAAASASARSRSTSAAHVLALRNDLSRQLTPALTLRVGFDGEQRIDSIFFNLPLVPDTRLYGLTRPEDRAAHDPARHAGGGALRRRDLESGRRRHRHPRVRGDGFRYVGQNRFTFDPRLVVRWKWSDVPHLEGGRRHLPPDGRPAAA